MLLIPSLSRVGRTPGLAYFGLTQGCFPLSQAQVRVNPSPPNSFYTQDETEDAKVVKHLVLKILSIANQLIKRVILFLVRK